MRFIKDKIEFHNKEFDKLTLEQKNLTAMMDNLYIDKLKGRITERYDRFYSIDAQQINRYYLFALSSYKKQKIIIILLQNTYWSLLTVLMNYL